MKRIEKISDLIKFSVAIESYKVIAMRKPRRALDDCKNLSDTIGNGHLTLEDK